MAMIYTCFEGCGAEGVVRGECCRCPLKVKITGQKDGHCLARGGGSRGPSFHIL